jgi:transcriptional regulator with XRE-family HTH domain
MVTDNYTIGQRIAKLRKERGITQVQFAEIMNISVKHCSAVERGASCYSFDKLIEVASYFDCSVDYLLRGIDENDVVSQLPPTILEIMKSDDEREKALLQNYLRLYTKLRKPDTPEEEDASQKS